MTPVVKSSKNKSKSKLALYCLWTEINTLGQRGSTNDGCCYYYCSKCDKYFARDHQFILEKALVLFCFKCIITLYINYDFVIRLNLINRNVINKKNIAIVHLCTFCLGFLLELSLIMSFTPCQWWKMYSDILQKRKKNTLKVAIS